MSTPTYVYPDDYNKLSSWFLGPKAENHLVLEDQFRKIVAYFKHGRDSYFPNDPDFINDTILQSQDYRKGVDKLDEVIEYMSIILAHHVVPFSSPRYAAHVTGDTNLPSTVGYLLGMLYNQNNVSPEASPLTGVIEYIVGQDLCQMIGYKTYDQGTSGVRPDEPIGWGHITCDGSVANFEAIWAARSLKYYPLSLFLAITQGPLNFVGPEFTVTLTGKSQVEKPFIQCTPWELFNLTPKTVLDLPDRLFAQYDISTDFLSSAMDPYLLQYLGIEGINRAFNIKHAPQYFVCLTKHYSLVKAASILGIGVENLVEVDIDDHARMNPDDLKQKLLDRITAANDDDKTPIYGVLSIMGSTEHSAVDPIVNVLDIRTELENDYGVSFMVHCDAAWGGYFASVIRPVPDNWDGEPPNEDQIVKPILPYVLDQLRVMYRADSVTLDSHKSGFCPYPAGGLCYRDQRTRLLIAVSSPYINTTGKGVESMGTFGLEGSKPGAAPLAVWTANVVIGLHQGGYGRMLSAAILTGVRYYTMWLTMSSKSKYLIVEPFNEFDVPPEWGQDKQAALEKIQRLITDRSYSEIIQDPDALDQIQSIGADLMINTFSCNFKFEDGTVNTDVAEANYLNARLYERLSLRRVTDNMNLVPFIVVGTVFSQSGYKDCLKHYKARLGLDLDDQDLHAFSSMAASPFVTDGFADEMGKIFQAVGEQEIQRCWKRIIPQATYHDFLIQGTDQVFFVYLPVFNVGSHRQQIVLTGTLPDDVMQLYLKARADDPSANFTIHTVDPMKLEDLLTASTVTVNVVQGLPLGYGQADLNLANNVELSNIKILKNHSLAPKYLDEVYPSLMPCYLYGTTAQQHIEHVLLKDQNVQLTASQVKLEVTPALPADRLQAGVIAVLTNRYENSMQPSSELHKPSFFQTGSVSNVTIYPDPFTYSADPNISLANFLNQVMQQSPIATGTLTIGQEFYSDATNINQDFEEVMNIVIPEDTTARDALSGIKRLATQSEVWLSDNIHSSLKQKVPSLFRGIEKKGANTARVSRFSLRKPQHALSKAVAIRDQWKGVVDSAGARGA